MMKAVVLTLLGASLAVSATAQTAEQKPDSSAPAVKTAAEAFKNIQVLKTIPADELQPTMRYIAGSLGVQCGFCHVMSPERDFAKDDKKEKQTAREMMKMVMTINQENFEGRQQVSCNSCHNGHAFPSIVPAVATEASIKEQEQQRANERGPGVQAQGQPAQQEQRPTAESLFEKYEQAIGGAAAIDKITSRYVKGAVTSPGGNSDFEQYNKAPDKSWVSTSTPRGARVQAFDGTQGWTQAGRVEPMRDVTDIKMNSDFYRNLKFTGRYKQARVFRKEKVGDRDAWVVMARVPNPQYTDMLYFDVDSGLLLRRTTLRRTALGPLPTTLDLSDYRDVDGVKMPFKVTIATPDGLQTVNVTEMKVNIPIEDSRFEMPNPEQGQ
jgi:photosynthetic reaction center cytochrome c subunit